MSKAEALFMLDPYTITEDAIINSSYYKNSLLEIGGPYDCKLLQQVVSNLNLNDNTM